MSIQTYFIELVQAKSGITYTTKPKPITEFNRSLANSRNFKTIVVWKIKPKVTAHD